MYIPHEKSTTFVSQFLPRVLIWDDGENDKWILTKWSRSGNSLSLLVQSCSCVHIYKVFLACHFMNTFFRLIFFYVFIFCYSSAFQSYLLKANFIRCIDWHPVYTDSSRGQNRCLFDVIHFHKFCTKVKLGLLYKKMWANCFYYWSKLRKCT